MKGVRDSARCRVVMERDGRWEERAVRTSVRRGEEVGAEVDLVLSWRREKEERRAILAASASARRVESEMARWSVVVRSG